MRSFLLSMLTVLVLSVAAAAEPPRDVLPPAKFTPPGAVVVSQCGSILAVVFTDDRGDVHPFPIDGLSFASVMLFVNRAGTIANAELPCAK